MIGTDDTSFVLKGNMVYANPEGGIHCFEHAYLICRDRKSAGVYGSLPGEYAGYPLIDAGDSIILPGMTDLHLHAPQYAFRGLGMDLELLEWLNANTFPEEAKYKDMTYAAKAYEIFVRDLAGSMTTRACIFATVHNEATLLLMELLERSGLVTYVGRVNMDRNCSPGICEAGAGQSAGETEEWLLEALKSFTRTKPILTPRFIPTCSDELMHKLSGLQRKYRLPVQSHLSENLSEIEWVRELVPAAACYGAAYDSFGLFGGAAPAIMAHCVYCTGEETELIRRNGVYIAHCPESNLNIASGIAPVRRYISQGLKLGLGTDVAGGSSVSMLKAMAHAVQSSKMYWRLMDQSMKPLTFDEVFFLATLGGGSFFGKVGSFLPDYEFDAVIIDDSAIQSPRQISLKDRAERMMYLPEGIRVCGKYVRGRRII